MTFGRRIGLLAWTLGLWLALGTWSARVAHADDAAPPTAADEERERKAKSLYEQGNTHYDLAEYDKAIELFKEAYALTRRPTLLYNIAQAYRLKGDCQQALAVYKNYLRVDPSSPFRVKVESRIVEMETCTKDPGRQKPVEKEAILPDVGVGAAAPGVAGPPGAGVAGAGAGGAGSERRGGGTKKMLGLISGGVGIALIATGGYFSLQAGDNADQVAERCAEATPCTWDAELEGLQSDGEAASRNAIIMYSIGGAAVVGGVVLYVLGVNEARAAPRLSFAPLRGGGALASAAWRF